MHEPDEHTTRLLITSGPTQEPIDAVRFIGNRSSGRLGASLADAAAARGWAVTMLAGCESRRPASPAVRVLPFRTTADLQRLLAAEVPQADILIMAAAVADYRPKAADLSGKRRRTKADLVLELEPTPDLLAGCASMRRAHHTFVGFALEPRAEMLASAQRKLERKGLDLIVANALETMDAEDIDATIIGPPGTPFAGGRSAGGPMPKARFAARLLDAIALVAAEKAAHAR